MIQTLIAFVLSLLGWSGLLWFGIKPDFLKLSTPLLVLLHLVPPLLVAVLVWWRARKEKTREADEARAREEAERKEREAAAATALAKHQEEMAWRRYGCDCRFVAVTGLLQRKEPEASKLENVIWESASAAPTSSQDVLETLQPHIGEALEALYKQCAAAQHFPIYLLPATNVAGEEALNAIRELTQAKQIAYLPYASDTPQRIINLFESQPELPGCVAIGFDSLPSAAAGEDEEKDLQGPSGQAVVALLLTHQDLETRLKKLEDLDSEQNLDPLTPYWDREEFTQAEHQLLSQIPQPQRQQLAELPVLARLHRGIPFQYPANQLPKQQFLQPLQDSLLNAFINAGVVQPEPPILASNLEQVVSTKTPASELAWLVHNAGNQVSAGPRLGGILRALSNLDIELDPFKQGHNTVESYGDTGMAQPLLLLALSARQAAQTGGPVLCTEYSSPGEASFYLTQPILEQVNG